MKKNSIIESLSTRKLRFGGYATLLIVGALAVVIVINVLVDQIPGKLDLTKNKIYSLSDETYKLLDSLKTDVTVTTVGKQGSEDPTVKTILGKYAAHSGHVKLQTLDPDLNPGWTKQYDTTGQGLGAGTLVVAAGKKFKTIGVYDMYNYDTSNYDPSNPNSQPQLTSLSVEQRVTSAVQYVTAEKNVTAVRAQRPRRAHARLPGDEQRGEQRELRGAGAESAHRGIGARGREYRRRAGAEEGPRPRGRGQAAHLAGRRWTHDRPGRRDHGREPDAEPGRAPEDLRRGRAERRCHRRRQEQGGGAEPPVRHPVAGVPRHRFPRFARTTTTSSSSAPRRCRPWN